MYIRSTGLGKTLLHCEAAKIEYTDIVPETLKMPSNGNIEPKRLLMTMTVTAPVSWTVRAFVEPGDIRSLLVLLLKNPKIILYGLRFLLFGGPSPSLAPAKTESKK